MKEEDLKRYSEQYKKIGNPIIPLELRISRVEERLETTRLLLVSAIIVLVVLIVVVLYTL